MKVMQWVGPAREVPPNGLCQKGDMISLRDHQANYFIKQGWVKLVKKIKEAKK